MASVPARMQELDPDAEIVVICHHGGRSMQVAHFLEHQGFEQVFNLAGGVHASVGAPGGVAAHRHADNRRHCAFQRILHGVAVGLGLPAGKPASVVFDA